MEITSVKKGAELTSIKINGVEKLHDGVDFWNRHSPILFPMVGRLKNDKAIIDGKEFEMKQHGFARDTEFECVLYSEEEQSYILKSSENTKKKYPYDFILNVTHRIEENKVVTEYKVINNYEKEMYFGIGGHPAYKIDYSNCYIELEQEETSIKFYELQDGLIAKEYHREMKNNKILNLNENIFENDAIIMSNVKSNMLYVKAKQNNEILLKFYFEDFPYLAIWSKKGAPFLCIEPWFTTADTIDSNGIFEEKQGTICLKPNEEFVCQYAVEF